MDQKQPALAKAVSANQVPPAMKADLQSEAAVEESTILLDPAIHIGPVFRLILLKVRENLSQFIELRSLSQQWANEVTETLQSQLSLKIFSDLQAMKGYMEQMNRFGLRDDPFYKLSETDPDELIGREVKQILTNSDVPELSNESKPADNTPESKGTHWPVVFTNVQKLIIANGVAKNLDLASILSQWTATLTSLVIFKLPGLKVVDDQLNWSAALKQMANLTRLELYDVYLNHIEVKAMANVLGQLEHFVVADEQDAVSVKGVDYCERLVKLLGALKPGQLKHLGLLVSMETYFTVPNLYELFVEWRQGHMLMAGLTSLQLGEASVEMLDVLVEQCKGLQCLSFAPSPGTAFADLLRTLTPLCSLHDLRLLVTADPKCPFLRNYKLLDIPRLTAIGELATLPSVCRLSLLCPKLQYYTRLVDLISHSFPSLEQLNLRDCRWNDNKPMYGELRAIPVTNFNWQDDYRSYFPERLWSKLPAKCDDQKCNDVVGHYVGDSKCKLEVIKRMQKEVFQAKNVLKRQRDEAGDAQLELSDKDVEQMRIAQVAKKQAELFLIYFREREIQQFNLNENMEN